MKKKFDPAKQVMAYTSDSPPPGLQGEQALNREPIKIEIVNYREKLDPASRIDLAKLHNVEHNVSICRVGDVKKAHLRRLIKYMTCNWMSRSPSWYSLWKELDSREAEMLNYHQGAI